MSTLKVLNVTHPNSSSPNMVLDANGNVTAAGTVSGSTPMTMRNRIINGDMRIDQRNSGAAVIATTDGQYTVDRFAASTTQSSKYAFQQNLNSITPPSSFTHYLGISVLSPVTVAATDYFGFFHSIEGYNVSDLAFGTSTASPVTLSFWVRSSIIGTYSVSFLGIALSYTTSYTISLADTWQKVVITIPGATFGTWNTTNGVGLELYFSLGMGSNFTAPTANTWNSSQYFQVSGQTQWIANAGATFYITGVQLEAGTVATPFERRPYGMELALCQRYYYMIGKALGAIIAPAANWSSTQVSAPLTFPVQMRVTPSFTQTSGTNYFRYDVAGSNILFNPSWVFYSPTKFGCVLYYNGMSGLTAGQAGFVYTSDANALVAFSAEL